MGIGRDTPGTCVVYQITNLINGKRYIGVTGLKRPSTRLVHHMANAKAARYKNKFMRALLKYGKSNFRMEILEHHPTIPGGLDAEIRLIRDLSPEYNSTPGGDGRPGGGAAHFTPEGRARVSAAHKGKNHRPNFRHSEETKKRLSELGRKGLPIFKKYMRLGPSALSKEVICLDDGKVYESCASAARAYELDSGALSELCRGKRYRRSLGGRHFAYADDVGQRWVA